MRNASSLLPFLGFYAFTKQGVIDQNTRNKKTAVRKAIVENDIAQRAIDQNNRAVFHKWFCIFQIAVAYRPLPPFA